MVHRREHLGLALEPHHPFGIAGNLIGQNFDGDVAIERRIPRAIDFAHAARTERGLNLIAAQAGAGVERHGAERMIHPREVLSLFPGHFRAEPILLRSQLGRELGAEVV